MIAKFISCLSFLTLPITGPQSLQEKTDEDVRCGIYCLTVAAKSLGQNIDLTAIETLVGEADSNGYSMDRLNAAAKGLGLLTRMSKTTLDQLSYRYDVIGERFVCITLIDDDHFVILSDIQDDSVSICDPPKSFSLDTPVFQKLWDGQVLLISKGPLNDEETVLASSSRRLTATRIGIALITGILVFVLAITIPRIVRNRRVKADE